MKMLKTIDYIVQAMLLGAGISIILVFGLKIDGPGLTMYFLLGGWQVMSVIVHFFIDKQYKIGLRTIYLRLLAFTILMAIFSLVGFILQFLFALVVWSPVLAVIYLVCCIKETNKMAPVAQESRP